MLLLLLNMLIDDYLLMLLLLLNMLIANKILTH